MKYREATRHIESLKDSIQNVTIIPVGRKKGSVGDLLGEKKQNPITTRIAEKPTKRVYYAY